MISSLLFFSKCKINNYHNPIALDHALVAPKEPYKDFLDVPNAIFDELTQVAREIYKKIEKNMNQMEFVCFRITATITN